MLRGGAIAAASEVIDITKDITANENAGSARGTEMVSPVPLQLRDITSQTCLLIPAPIAGVIDGVSYEAAWTNGDGACGLHALFGDCSRGDLIRQHGGGVAWGRWLSNKCCNRQASHSMANERYQ